MHSEVSQPTRRCPQSLRKHDRCVLQTDASVGMKKIIKAIRALESAYNHDPHLQTNFLLISF